LQPCETSRSWLFESANSRYRLFFSHQIEEVPNPWQGPASVKTGRVFKNREIDISNIENLEGCIGRTLAELPIVIENVRSA
jgi:hypothetical protein